MEDSVGKGRKFLGQVEEWEAMGEKAVEMVAGVIKS